VRKKQANEASNQFFFWHSNPIFFAYTHFFILQDLSPTTPGKKAPLGKDIPRNLANATPSQPIPSQQPKAPVRTNTKTAQSLFNVSYSTS